MEKDCLICAREFQNFVREELRDLEKKFFDVLKIKKDSRVIDAEVCRLRDVDRTFENKVEKVMNEVRKPHTCFQDENIKDIVSDVKDIKRVLYRKGGWKVGGTISLVIAILAGAMFIFDIRTDTLITKSQVIDMKHDVVSLQEESARLESTVRKQAESHDKKYQRILQSIKAIDSRIGRSFKERPKKHERN